MTLRIKITKDQAKVILKRISGGRKLYEQLAAEFLKDLIKPK